MKNVIRPLTSHTRHGEAAVVATGAAGAADTAGTAGAADTAAVAGSGGTTDARDAGPTPRSRTPRARAAASRAAAPIAKRSATPVKGGMPRRPRRIAAQVVPQISVNRPSVA